MNLLQAAHLCRKFEGFRSKPYLCPANVWTIGYGSTYYPGGRRVQPADEPITEAYADQILMHELAHTYATGVIKLCPEVFANAMRTGGWGPFNALVDFTYNLGVGRLQTSTLRRKARALDWEGVKEELAKWTRGGGKVLPGLVKRRAAEAALL
jgi:lysozyme